ncbi:MAG: M23 family metallopeptidase, partial [Gammaproteobacteria bacterium]|nr:M23 family metallopeptidase [Gammaproteobacteria bacterium]
AGVLAGYRHGVEEIGQRLLTDEQLARQAWQKEVRANLVAVAQTRQDLENSLAEIATRTGVLQAHVTRLDAVASQVVAMAGLPEEEFNLQETPPVGGPVGAAGTPQWIRVLETLDKLNADLADREDQLEVLEQLLRDRETKQALAPSGLPLDKGWVSSGFGTRIDPLSGVEGFHAGVDLSGKMHTHIRAVADGIVITSDRYPEYGNMVEISHGNGVTTRYAHNDKNLVQVGERITRDQTIATLGRTGRTTGPHLHFEVLKDGKQVNPKQYLQAKK